MVISSPEEIEEVVVNFCKNLFKKDSTDERAGQEMLAGVKDRLESDDIRWLDSPILCEEVKCAIEGLNRRRSPGEDGLTAECFVQFKEAIAPLLCSLLII